MRAFRGLLVALVIAIAAGNASADDRNDAAKALGTAVERLGAAFSARDADAIRSLMTEDHYAVSPNYGRAYSVDDQIETLGQLEYNVTGTTNERYSFVDDNTILVTMEVFVDGAFEGKPLPGHIFVSQLWVRQDGRWLQRLYQETAIGE